MKDGTFKPKGTETLFLAYGARHKVEVIRYKLSGYWRGDPDGPAVSGCAYYITGAGLRAGSLWSENVTPAMARDMARDAFREHHPKAYLTVVVDLCG